MEKKRFLFLEENEENKKEDSQNADTPKDDSSGGGESDEGGGDFGFLDDETLDKASENLQKMPDTNPLDEEDEESVSGDDLADDSDDDKNNIYKNEDEEKVKKLFTDTGDPKVDYSLNSDSNKRLAKFKFKYAGIDIDSLMTDQEKKTGIRVDQLLSRLLPDQYEMYIQKSRELRKEFPLIAERERKIVIYNCNIPFYYKNKKGEMKLIKHKRDLANAINKVDKFMLKSFGENWVDDKYAIEFLQNIQVDFSSDKKIKSNLLSVSLFTEKNFTTFNKFYIEMPDSVKKFISKNLENKQFENSNLFKIFVNDYEQSEISSKISIFPLIKVDEKSSEESKTEGAESSDETGGEDSGEMGDEFGGEMGGEAGEEVGGGTSEETGGEAGESEGEMGF